GTLWRYATASRLLRRARVDGESKVADEVRSLLTLVASRRPNWRHLAVCQGQLAELLGDREAAANHYPRAIELGERGPPIIHQALRLLYGCQRYADVIQVVQRLPEQAVVLNDLHGVAVDAWLRSGDYTRALELAEKAVTANPRDYRNHLWLGQVYWAVGRK